MLRLKRIAFTSVLLVAGAVLTSCTGGATPTVVPPIEVAPLVLKAPSADVLADYQDVLASHPEWRGLTPMEFEVNFTVSPRVSPDSEAVSDPGGQSGTPGNQYVCGTGSLSTSWKNIGGVETPPNCTGTGELRRVFSTCCKSGMDADILLPSDTTTMPHGPNQLDAIEGFIYEEGWPASGPGQPGGNNSEGGLEYSALQTHDYYNLYLASNYYRATSIDGYIVHGTMVNFHIDTTTSGKVTLPKTIPKGDPTTCSGGCVKGGYALVGGSCPMGDLCMTTQRMAATYWSGNCCYFSTVTSIARNTPYIFTSPSGYTFGPVPWSGLHTHTTAGPDASFAFGGLQSYPNSTRYVKATSINSTTHAETDTVFLPAAVSLKGQ
jgi:hypothetical protein